MRSPPKTILGYLLAIATLVVSLDRVTLAVDWSSAASRSYESGEGASDHTHDESTTDAIVSESFDDGSESESDPDDREDSPALVMPDGSAAHCLPHLSPLPPSIGLPSGRRSPLFLDLLRIRC